MNENIDTLDSIKIKTSVLWKPDKKWGDNHRLGENMCKTNIR